MFGLISYAYIPSYLFGFSCFTIITIISTGVSYVLMYNSTGIIFFNKFGKLNKTKYLFILHLAGIISSLIYIVLAMIIFYFLNYKLNLYSTLAVSAFVSLSMTSYSNLVTAVLTKYRLNSWLLTGIYPLVVVVPYILAYIFRDSLNIFWHFVVSLENGSLSEILCETAIVLFGLHITVWSFYSTATPASKPTC
ncbi:hypothetical protein ATY89_03710 [Sulfolobus acidocaldarius]|nr:hypothetical protein SacN8_02595 [Sulfolobus acidocaldarius N8]AGE72770.1 hypothetical protein SacRon12I_02585 [Sulfolobus acidocaldarius Ron12/I]ALU30553.1 hypothetical protein ATY89_03710 [Sulfolobus acidocaldarius]ALU32817.1 hypothetical protein ATZ20_06735 [Sulfolobus acidocaldarius]WCM35998.1 hypothetical protein GO597_03565 [Sulfolobus acidocaldarius DSM 639]